MRLAEPQERSNGYTHDVNRRRNREKRAFVRVQSLDPVASTPNGFVWAAGEKSRAAILALTSRTVVRSEEGGGQMFGAPSVVAASSLAVPNMLHFVYGTLMCPDVLMELCGRVPTLVPGVLNGFRRFQVPDHVYPAIVPDERPESCVNGLLVCGLDEIDVAVFDNFEGDEYNKAAVQVQVPKEKHGVPPGLHNAYVYVWKPKPGQPLVDPWSYEETFLPHLRDYLIMTKEFRDSLVDIPRSKLK